MTTREELLSWLIVNKAFTDDSKKSLTSGITKRLRKNLEVINDFKRILNIQSDDVAELIYNVVNPDCNKTCEVCGKPTSFDKYYNGYRKACCCQCAVSLSKRKGAQTKKDRYGTSRYNNSEKNRQTKLERYGDAFYTNVEKGRQTKLEKYDYKKYLFVVDSVEKYKDNIVETLENKSHFGKNKEYVVLIEK